MISKKDAMTFDLDKGITWKKHYTVKFRKQRTGTLRKEQDGTFLWLPCSTASKDTLDRLKTEAVKRRWYISNIEYTEADLNCLSKKSYQNSEKAMLSIFFKPTHTDIAPYKCNVCQKWHVTKDRRTVKEWGEKWDTKLLIKHNAPSK